MDRQTVLILIYVRLEEFSSIDCFLQQIPVANFIIFNLNGEVLDDAIKIFDNMITLDRFESCLLMFPDWKSEIDTLTYVMSQNTGGQLAVSQILFDQSSTLCGDIIENVQYCILLSKVTFYEPPIDMYNKGLENISCLVLKVCPPLGCVCYVSVGDTPLVNLHENCTQRRLVYFACKKRLETFKLQMEKEKIKDAEPIEKWQKDCNDAIEYDNSMGLSQPQLQPLLTSEKKKALIYSYMQPLEEKVMFEKDRTVRESKSVNNIYKFGSTKPVGTVESMNSVKKSYHAEMDELEQKLVAVDENVM